MIAEGVLDGVEEIYGQHNAPIHHEGSVSVKHGPMMAGSVDVNIDIEGKGGHGSEPALSVDPITAMCHIHVALHSVRARCMKNSARASMVFGVCNSGSVRNVIPKTARMEGKIRWFD